MRSRTACGALAALAFALGGCAHAPADDPHDPLEPVNRKVYAFNEVADHFVSRPLARGYDKVMPSVARTGIRNFFSNLGYPTVIVNDLLQLKGQAALQDFCRFVLNSTFGLAGIVDVATMGGLPENDEDFGQTLGYWGVGEGWYLMLPFLGPASNRDIVGRGVDAFSSPLLYTETENVSWGLGALNGIETRAGLLPADKFVAEQLDRYVFIRTVYLQSRQNKVYDGNPPEEDYGFEEEEQEEDAAVEALDRATDADQPPP